MPAEGRTYLELCNLAAGFTGDHGLVDRGSLSEFRGEIGSLPRHVSVAWDELCNSRPDWFFLREDNYITKPLRDNQNIQQARHLLGDDWYNFSHWNDQGVFRGIVNGQDEYYCRLAEYEWLRDHYWDRGGYGYVNYVAIMPTKDLYVSGMPQPGLNVQLRCDWYRSPKVLGEGKENEMIDLPRQHEMVVVYRALNFYFRSIGDKSRAQDALVDYASSRSQLMETEIGKYNFDLPDL